MVHNSPILKEELATSASLGPISRHLLSELSGEIQRHGIVVWLDLDDHYGRFVDRLARDSSPGELNFDVVAYRGSFLEMMLGLERLASGADKSRLLLHMPGFNEESIKATPALELYRSGARFRRSLDTLVDEAAGGKVKPEQIASFKQEAGLTLDKADAWLHDLLTDDPGGLASALRPLSLTALVDDLLGSGFVATRLGAHDNLNPLWQHLEARTGLDQAWRESTQHEASLRGESAAYALASWAMCVEYVHDLTRPPYQDVLRRARNLPQPVIKACRELCEHLRERHVEVYRRWAEETENRLDQEVMGAVASDLGKVDTFRFEEETILKAALEKVGEGDWKAALDWARPRVAGSSFWVRTDPQRQAAWYLVLDAAELGEAITSAGSSLGKADDLEGAVEHYRQHGAAVDLAHRRLEQRRVVLLYPQVPNYPRLRTCLDGMRVRWRAWADAWAIAFSRLCRQTSFVPPPELQQRTLFEQVVVPLTRDPQGVTALFVVDAFRYEMAEELRQSLDTLPATTVHLRARLAELPSKTEVGMNALAPIEQQGRLRLVLDREATKIRGFTTGEFQVLGKESRQKAMHNRVSGERCPWLMLGEVVSIDLTTLKQKIARSKLVVVHCTDIDDAGESGMGVVVFDHVMKDLRAAHKLLRDAGVRRFVFTADHGYLLVDETTVTAQPHGRKIDPHRRHVLTAVPADHPGEVRVPLADLGYDDASGVHLVMPESTAVFDTGKRFQSFVHGGGSLQERVIPVLTVEHRAAAGGERQSYLIEAEYQEGVADLHSLKARVRPASQIGLSFGGRREVELGLRVTEVSGVTVELCQTRKAATLQGGALRAQVDQDFEVFFRLHGLAEERVRVELYHPGGSVEVAACSVDGRYPVRVLRGAQAPEAPPASRTNRAWLDELPAGGVRQFFEHLDAHGTVTEEEAVRMLGGPSQLRRFSIAFERHALRAPFAVRIDSVGGVKRYVKEGGAREQSR